MNTKTMTTHDMINFTKTNFAKYDLFDAFVESFDKEKSKLLISELNLKRECFNFYDYLSDDEINLVIKNVKSISLKIAQEKLTLEENKENPNPFFIKMLEDSIRNHP
jgi:hypothetical protein